MWWLLALTNLEDLSSHLGWVDTHPHVWHLEAIYKAPAKAPASAQARQTCHVRVLVERTGDVESVQLEQPTDTCDDAFARASLLAASRWTFAPHRVRGSARPASTVVHYEFWPGQDRVAPVDLAWGPAHLKEPLSPTMPAGHSREVVCQAMVEVDERGRPGDVTIEAAGCPRIYQQAATLALSDAEYWPDVSEGEARPSRVRTEVLFPTR